MIGSHAWQCVDHSSVERHKSGSAQIKNVRSSTGTPSRLDSLKRMSAPRPHSHWCIDLPTVRPVADTFTVQGWVAADSPVHALVPADGSFASVEWFDRPDLVPPPDGRAWARGFRARLSRTALRTDTLVCRAHGGGQITELTWQFRQAVDPARKTRKLDRIQAELLAPGVRPVRTADYLNFLPPGTPIEEPALTSGYGYPENIEALVARHRDGWVLDYGAGNRPEYLDNVVNLELAPYPSTDVMNGDMRLPFRDGCFDAIVTLAVLEHVREPWSVARELVRVLKPGGTLIADVPFLQPVHAYPSHFFNMTAEGLKSLFADTCDIESSEVPHYGRPIYTLTWFLQRYCDGLPPEQRAKFSQLRVADLLAPAGQQAKQDYVAQLPKEFNFELASVTTVVARKR